MHTNPIEQLSSYELKILIIFIPKTVFQFISYSLSLSCYSQLKSDFDLEYNLSKGPCLILLLTGTGAARHLSTAATLRTGRAHSGGTNLT